MQPVRIAVLAVVVALSVSAAAAASYAPGSSGRHCRSGSTPATIAGKHVCLRPGARCTRRLDRAYHRYRFHCHSGRLARFPAAPQPAAPPTLLEPPAPAGQLVDVGGYRIHLECVGTGSPTVVMEAGATATRLGGRKVQYALSSDTRVCSYDRPEANLASASDPRPVGVAATSETFARELRTLLANANVPGPYLLAGSSFGGFLISTFTARYPDQVAGLVFIDALAPGSAEAFARQPGAILEPWDASGDFDRLRTLSFGARPVVALVTQLVGEIPDLRRRATNIIVAEAPQYPHIVVLDTPGLAYEGIRVAVAAVRAGGPLPPCAQTPLARIVRRCAP